jgi:hypothetical protein
MPNGTTLFNWHPQARSWRYTLGLGIIVSAGVVCWCTRRSGDGWPCLISLLFALAGSGLLIEQESRVDENSHTLCREGRLFGRFRLWLRCRPLSEFSAIRVRTYRDSDGNDNVFVELLQHSGQPLAVRYFYGAACSEARGIAQSLARATGLPLDERQD